jgi:hypothetical protein
MRRTAQSTVIIVVPIALLLGCQDQDTHGLGPVNIETTNALVGNVNQVDPAAWVPAVARLTISYTNPAVLTSLCSGTLVTANRILTAAHCFCPKQGSPVLRATVDFAGANGIIPAGAPTWVSNSIVLAPGALVCPADGDPSHWESCNANDPMSHGASDVAVVTLAPNAATPVLPPATPVNVFLGDPLLNFGAASPGGRLIPNFRVAGYGNNFAQDFFVPDTCIGCNLRRSGPMTPNNPTVPASLLKLALITDAQCETIPFTSIKDPCPQNCWNGRQWGTASVVNGELLETAGGDSGGPLIFAADSAAPLVAGVASSWYPDPFLIPTQNPFAVGHTKWATTGDNADFIWGALGLPFSITLAEQQARTAVFTRQDLNIDDRARVVANPPSPIVGRLVANGLVWISTDAVVGDIHSRATIQIRDRATAANVISSKEVQRGNATNVASVSQGVFRRFEDFTLPVSFSPPNTNLNINSSMTLAPGMYGNVTVSGTAELTLTDGLYVFRSFIGNSGSRMRATGTRTWIFVMSTSWLIWRNSVLAPAGGLFVGAPNAPGITVGNNFAGTLVAPDAMVDVDMVNQAVFTGSVFARSFRLHQGQFLRFAPFSGRWIPTCTTGGGFQTCT